MGSRCVCFHLLSGVGCLEYGNNFEVSHSGARDSNGKRWKAGTEQRESSLATRRSGRFSETASVVPGTWEHGNCTEGYLDAGTLGRQD